MAKSALSLPQTEQPCSAASMVDFSRPLPYSIVLMSVQPTDQVGRRFEFDPTEAVVRSRANARFISCPACRADAERYLFHERGARFVQCRSCDAVFVNPPARELRDYFDVHAPAGGATIEDREHVRKEV